MMKVNRQTAWLAHARKIAERVASKRDEMSDLGDDELRARIQASADRIKSASDEGKALDLELVDVYATVCVAAKRAIGLSPYDVQIIGAVALHEGAIAEAKTGEGKSLMAAMPSILHALTGRGSHVVTVNPYLAERDSENIGSIARFLGLTVGCVLPGMGNVTRRDAYACDITYVSNTELGFDWLRDNMVVDARQMVQRGLVYAIVDEADSILIDEAKTPLIISGMGKDVSLLCERIDAVVSKLEKGTESRPFNRAEAMIGVERVETGDYIVHERERNVILTSQGIAKIEAALGIENYADAKNRSIQHAVEQSLQAHALFRRDKDYIVRGGKVLLVDQNTGRTMEGRQYSDGLHQAIEAKAHVAVSSVNETIGTTSYQNFFRKYEVLSGMTGTAWTEHSELWDTYRLRVRVIPTNRPMIRVDEPDRLYDTAAHKHEAVVKPIQEALEKGRPVLVGTASVEESEVVSGYLKRAGIEHQVLSAKQDEHEAEVVAKAGIHGTVTVATNMAGRGTDIVLDDEARKAGGLLVIGCEKHEDERIDNQLRGRSGRQGDPGTSAFYISMEDRVMRLYGAQRFAKGVQMAGATDETGRVVLRSVMRAIRTVQKRVALDNWAMRRDTLAYDDINDAQRERIYAERRAILAKEDVTEQMRYAMAHAIKHIARTVKPDELGGAFEALTGIKFEHRLCDEKGRLYNGADDMLVLEAEKAAKAMEFTDDDIRKSYTRRCLLVAIDSAWAEQLRALEFCRNAVGYSGYGQMDPKAAYGIEAYDLYGRMLDMVYAAAVFTFFAQRPDRKAETTVDGMDVKLKSGKDMVV